MFDPTVFENLKVAFENRLYDLDNLDEIISITGRSDLMDFAVLGRSLSLRFIRTGQPDVEAEICLSAGAEELAGEILEKSVPDPGCTLAVRFFAKMERISTGCERIEAMLNRIWEEGIRVEQTLSFVYPQEEPVWLNRIEAKFHAKLGEENINELGPFIDSVLEAMDAIGQIRASGDK
ncbi:hypothetical protein [Bhargavaea cecembensis]|uniref:hypothetical protein n=1 Tax=Bhargavaea cecembensis TaxID=394098 RepID=UPI00058B581C|nr:hypothetical protein [Bhargavaea cecembensis]